MRRVRALIKMNMNDLNTVAKSATSKSKKAEKKETQHHSKHISGKDIARAADRALDFRIALRNMIAPTTFTEAILAQLVIFRQGRGLFTALAE